VAAAIAISVCALFSPAWPQPALGAVLLISGFFTSLLFTGYNALAFVDVDQSKMSAATSLYATFQQISLSLGICFAASLLELRGSMDAANFSGIFLLIGLVAFSATFTNRLLRPDAGTSSPPAQALDQA